MTTPNLPATLPAPDGGRRLWLLFGLGVLSILPVGLASTVTIPLATAMSSPLAQLLTVAFLGSSLPEELMRFAVLYYVGMRWIGFTRPRDGLVFGVLVSLGFSCAENIFYAVSIGWATGLLKLTIATPIHLALGVIMGSLLAVAAGSPSKRRSYTAYALAAPVLLHGTYDLVLLTALADGGAGAFARLALPVTCYLLVGATAVLTVLRSRQASASAA